MTLFSIMEELQKKKVASAYTVARIEVEKDVFIGLDPENKPSIFIVANEQKNLPNIKTSQVKVEFSKKYKLLEKGRIKKEQLYHAIHCLSTEQADTRAFLTVIESLLKQPGLNLNSATIYATFNSLINLFGIKASTDFINERKGLWAELYFMKQYGGFKEWAPYWHTEPTRIFDFSNGNKRIEIKSTTNMERIHEFSHRQLMALPSEEVVIVSILLQEDDTGCSLADLIAEARAKIIGTSNYIKLEKAIRKTGMTDSEEGPKFNIAYVNQKVAWYKAADIPQFPTEEPNGVSGTHYKSDLTAASSFSAQEVEASIKSWKECLL